MPESNDPENRDQSDTQCEPNRGPTREAGGTTGAGNLSPASANRTGGATSGVRSKSDPAPDAESIPPDP
jgi:hypothetical protein